MTNIHLLAAAGFPSFSLSVLSILDNATCVVAWIGMFVLYAISLSAFSVGTGDFLKKSN